MLFRSGSDAPYGGFHDPLAQETERAKAARHYYQAAKIPMPVMPQNVPQGYPEWLAQIAAQGIGDVAEGAGRAIRFVQAPGL